MPLEVFQPAPFEYPWERDMFKHLESSLRERAGNSPDTHILITNYMVNGRVIDALFVARGIFAVIEMKSYAGDLVVSENSPWSVNGKPMLESADGNPLRQVHSYRWLLHDLLKDRSPEYRTKDWRAPDAVVLFRGPITLKNSVPKGVENWFWIADLTNFAERLLTHRNSNILRSDNEILRLKRALDPGRPAGAPQTSKTQARFEIPHFRESEFASSLSELKFAGLEYASAARAIEERFGYLKKLPTQNPFGDLPFRACSEITGSIAYAINEKAEFVGLKNGHHRLIPLFAGSNERVSEWLRLRAGMMLTVEGDEYRLAFTVVSASEASSAPMPGPLPTTVPKPYLAQIAGPDLEAVMPAGFIRGVLEQFDEATLEEHMEDVLASLAEDSRLLFRDLFRLLRGGEQAGAAARLSLRLGNAIPAADAPAALDEAVGSASNSDQIVILNDLTPEQMKEILDLDKFKEWMYYLHPDQKRYVEDDYEKPVVLTGVSGSGKTCILVHRVRHLARKYPNERIALFTLNRNLAGLLRELVKDLLTPEEGKNVHVYAFYDYFSVILDELGAEAYLQQLAKVAAPGSPFQRVIAHVDPKKLAREVDIKSQETIEDTWDDFLESGDDDFKNTYRPIGNLLSRERVNAHRYLREEFTLIRSMWSPEARREQYPGFDRSDFSRAIAFLQDIRLDVLNLLLRYEEFMLEGGMLDVLSLTHALLPLRQRIRELPPEKRFRFVLIDEFQDFSNLDLVILREVCTHAGTDGMFLAGDLVQKILVKKLVLREAGFDSTASRWLKIRRNFRNSRQILEAAFVLAKKYGELARSRKEEVEVLNPELAVRETAKPFALKTDYGIDKAWEIAYRMVGQEKRAPWTICLATANKDTISTEELMDRRPVALPAQLLSADWIKKRDHVAVCDISELKGFEFHLVLIVGLDRGVFPESGVPEEERWRDALRLYVAMTRARDELYLIYQDTPSGFLESMRPFLEWRTDNRSMELARQIKKERKQAHIPLPGKTWETTRGDYCGEWFSPTQLRHLRVYFMQTVHKMKNLGAMAPRDKILAESSKDGLFKIWLVPENLTRITHRELVGHDQAGRVLTDEIEGQLKARGLQLAPPGSERKKINKGHSADRTKKGNLATEDQLSLKELRQRHRDTGGRGPVVKL